MSPATPSMGGAMCISMLQEGWSVYRRFFACCRSHTRRQKVEIAHMELAEPSIGAAVAKCASEGYRKVVVAPYFLSRGRHITSDIPAMVAEAQRAHPEVSCVIGAPIGVPPASMLWLLLLVAVHACDPIPAQRLAWFLIFHFIARTVVVAARLQICMRLSLTI